MSDSPAKKLDFESAGKENAPASLKPTDAPTDKIVEKPAEAPKAAPTMAEIEANEPLLQENPRRFVLFPIKYHEVSVTSPTRPRVKCFQTRRTPLHPTTPVLTMRLMQSTSIDLANVQEGRGLLLDRRGD